MTTYIVSANDLNGILDAAVGGDFVFVNENILVSNPVGNGIQLDDAFNSVTIHGHVVSADAIGIHLSAGSGTTGQNVLTIGASGSAQGLTVAVRMDDGSNTLINNGGIHGVGSFANGATIGGSNNLVVNNGVISASSNGIGFSSGVAGTNQLENFGLIQGGDNAIFGSSATDDTVINRGNISGNVTFFGGADHFDNDGGTITGRINMGADNDTLLGGAGRERALGGAGADEMDFGGGNDVYLAGNPEGEGAPDGNDDLDGGDGIDTYDASTTFANTVISLIEHRAFGTDIGNDFVFNFESVAGGSGADNIAGDDGRNVLKGNSGADILTGRAGIDRLNGGDAADTLTGGADRDILQGGAGADRFDFNASSESATGVATRDIILDFELGIDDIDLSTIDANGVGAGNTAFVYIGAGAFTNTAGELRLGTFAALGISVIQGDTNGDGTADIEIQLKGALVLAAGDFIL